MGFIMNQKNMFKTENAELIDNETGEKISTLSGDLPPRSRPEDPDTSKKAEPDIDDIGEVQKEVLWLFATHGDMIHRTLINKHRESCSELVDPHAHHRSRSGIRTRCSELVDMGLVEDTGEKRENYIGNPCIVWGLVEHMDSGKIDCVFSE